MDIGFSSVDQGNVYRTLRKLEKENLISSTWDTSEGGPAKRIYSLTEYGEKYLATCATSLSITKICCERFSRYIRTHSFHLPLLQKRMKRILHLHLVVQQSNLRSQYAKTFGGQTMETKPYELVDAFWKNWSQSLSLFSSAGKQLEQLTLETLKQQQDALHKLTSGVDELEKNCNNSLLNSIINIQIT